MSLKYIAQPVMRLGIVGPAAKRLPIVGHGLIEFSLPNERVAQPVVRFGIIRPQGQGLAVVADCLVESVGGQAGVAQATAGLGVGGVRQQHAATDLLGIADIPGLVGLYAKLGRMRVISSDAVVEAADHIAKKILDTYLEPDKSFVELRDMAKTDSIDLLYKFSIACREEFDRSRVQQL